MTTPAPAPAPAPEPERRSAAPLRYGSAVLGVGLATLARLCLNLAWGSALPYLVFFPAVAFSAWHGGLGPGLLALALSAASAAYFVLPPLYSLRIASPVELTGIVGFLLTGGLLAFLGGAQREARARAEASRREAERAVLASAASEARLSGILEAAMDAILVVDEGQRLVGLNPAAERMFGYPDGEALGQPLALLLPERFHRAHAHHVRGFGDSGVTGRSMGALGALTARRKDGTEFPIEAAISQTRAGGGGGLLFTAIVRDITERRQMEEERASAAEKQARVAEAMQRSLLLVPPPDAFPGVTVKAVYESAWDDALIGGDFFDVFSVSENRVALVVGDVTGKGLQAATFTAEVKFALRAFLREDADPARALSRLNRFVASAQRFDKMHLGATYVAAAVAVVDTLTGALACSSAGMEPPLVIDAASGAGEAAVTELTAGGPLLGVLPESEYGAQGAALSEGAILAMTTDGITEARRVSPEARRGGELFGLEGLAAAIRDLAHLESLAEIGKAAAERALRFAGGKRQDDVCLLLARRAPFPPGGQEQA